jgi:hypothetical protein
LSFHPKMRAARTQSSCFSTLTAVIEAGATTLNIPDNDWMEQRPVEFDFSSAACQRQGADKVVFSTHRQNDSGDSRPPTRWWRQEWRNVS